MTRSSLCGSLVFVAAIAAVSAQQPAAPAGAPGRGQSGRPTFQSNVDVTLVDFRVTDYNGNFISDIKQNEIVVREDGKEQPISMFRLVTAPAATTELTTSRMAGTDVESNTDTNDGHVYTLILDDVHGHPLRSATVSALAREFVEHHLSDADQVSIVPLSGRRSMIQEFTRNRQAMLTSIDQVVNGFGDGGDRSRYFTSLMKRMANIEGRRKAMVLIAEDVESFIRPFSMDLDELLATSKRANVSIYIVDSTGVPTGPSKGIKPVPLDDPAAFSNMRKAGMLVLATATGGLSFGTTSNDFSGAFRRIVKENSSYYLLGYPSTNKQDGQLHKIEVRLKRPRLPWLYVRTRSGYIADKPVKAAASAPSVQPTPENIADLLSSPVIVPGLTMNVSAAPKRGNTLPMSEVVVVLEASAANLTFTQGEDEARFGGALNVHIVATDLDGKVVAEERALATMSLGTSAQERTRESGVRVVSSLDLKKPGRYHLKIAAADANGGRVGGLVHYDVVVPDFWKEPLAMSGIVVGAKSTATIPTMGSAVARWESAGDAPPTTARVFGADDEIRSYVEVYGVSSADRPISVVTTVREASGATVFTREESLPPASDTARQVTTDVPLRALPPGEYTLSIVAQRDPASADAVRRDVPFRRAP